MTRSKKKPSKEALAITTGKTLAHKKKGKKNGAGSSKKGKLSGSDLRQNIPTIKKVLKDVSKQAAKDASTRLKKMFKGKPGHRNAKTKAEALTSLGLTYNRARFACKMLEQNTHPAYLLKYKKPNHRALYFPDY